MKRISILITLLLCTGLFATEQNLSMIGAEVTAGFYDKTLYYPGMSTDNPINIRITIANKGTQTIRFKLADDRMFSLDFLAVTAKNKPLPNTAECVRKRTINQTVFFREIALEPGEEYSFIENLKEYIEIETPAVYYVEARFFPELYEKMTAMAKRDTAKSNIVSNKLTVDVKPFPGAAQLSSLPQASLERALLNPQPISPDKVVEYTIVSRQKNLWDQYFLYMDIEQMLINDPVRNRQYRNESAAMRVQMLENYKMDLRQERINRDIVAIPNSFEIERTTYTKNEGTVTVIEKFKYDTFTEKKKYIYKLRQRDGIWRIYNYSVENLGTE